jgi:hypothetical protein
MNVYCLYDGINRTYWKASTPTRALELAGRWYANLEPRARSPRARANQLARYVASIKSVDLIGKLENP